MVSGRDLRDPPRVSKCGSERLLNIDRLAAHNRLTKLIEVGTPVDALQQDSIHQRTKVANLGNEANMPFLLQLLAEPIDSITTDGNVGVATFEGCDLHSAGHMSGGCWIIQ